MSPHEFSEFAEGWTLVFERDGEPFGSERFDANGRTTWRYRDGSCTEGTWRPHGAQLCFLYRQDPEIQCWRVLRDDEGLMVRLLTGDSAGLELRVAGRNRNPLLCGDPGEKT